MTTAWSYGGGVQSVAIGVLIGEGALPVPDLAGIADTSRERKTTWQYMGDVMQPYLDKKGVKLRIERVPHTLARVDLYAPTSDKPLVPAYTKVPVEKTDLFGDYQEFKEGRLPTYCSGEWKRDVFERWLRLMGVEGECDTWIGYSLDELWRVKKDHRPWCHYRHPLIERKITREMCLLLIEKAGLPRPHKSRCYDCPHQSPEEWQEVRASPDEWPLAVERDELIRGNDQHNGLYLYSGRVPLKMANFAADAGVVAPGRPCETGHCWT